MANANMSQEQSDLELKALLAKADGDVEKDAAAAAAMCEFVLLAATRVVNGTYVNPNISDLGKHFYRLNGRNEGNTPSFSQQASKIAKCIKLAMRWDKRGLPTLADVIATSQNQYNKALSLIGRINEEAKGSTLPPSHDEIVAWSQPKPKKEKAEPTKADMADAILKSLKALLDVDKNAHLGRAMENLLAYTGTAGATTVAIEAAKEQEKRKSEYATLIAEAKKAAKNSKADGANA
jgi:hypothetical protein